MRILRAFSLVLLVGLLSGCEALLFYPQSTLLRTPAQVGVTYEDVVLDGEGGVTLHAWWLPAEIPRATLIFAHGNAENISTHLAGVYWLPAQGINVLLVDYRGYGRSTGYPSVSGAVSDLQVAVRWLEDKETGLPWFALGQSLGASLMGAAVTGLPPDGRRHLAGVVLDAGFSEYARIAKEQAAKHWLTWSFQYPAAWAMPDGYDLSESVPAISPAPLLLIHGERDAVIGVEHARRLYAAAKAPKQLFLYDGGHIETFQRPEGREALLDFIASSLRQWAPPD